MVDYLADELTTRGHSLIDQSSITQIRAELDRLSYKLISVKDTQSSLIQHLKDISTRLFLIGAFDYILVKRRLEDIL